MELASTQLRDWSSAAAAAVGAGSNFSDRLPSIDAAPAGLHNSSMLLAEQLVAVQRGASWPLDMFSRVLMPASGRSSLLGPARAAAAPAAANAACHDHQQHQVQLASMHLGDAAQVKQHNSGSNASVSNNVDVLSSEGRLCFLSGPAATGADGLLFDPDQFGPDSQAGAGYLSSPLLDGTMALSAAGAAMTSPSNGNVRLGLALSGPYMGTGLFIVLAATLAVSSATLA